MPCTAPGTPLHLSRVPHVVRSVWTCVVCLCGLHGPSLLYGSAPGPTALLLSPGSAPRYGSDPQPHLYATALLLGPLSQSSVSCAGSALYSVQLQPVPVSALSAGCSKCTPQSATCAQVVLCGVHLSV